METKIKSPIEKETKRVLFAMDTLWGTLTNKQFAILEDAAEMPREWIKQIMEDAIK